MILNIIVITASLFVIGLVVLTSRKDDTDNEKTLYQYAKKARVMTEHELEYYKILQDAVGDKYYILAQAHLSAFLDNKVPNGQNWKAAFRNINSKSVDFLLCDRETLAPLLAIELDDKTHEQLERRLRDEEVERIFSGVKLPLLRIPSHGETTLEELKSLIAASLKV